MNAFELHSIDIEIDEDLVDIVLKYKPQIDWSNDKYPWYVRTGIYELPRVAGHGQTPSEAIRDWWSNLYPAEIAYADKELATKA